MYINCQLKFFKTKNIDIKLYKISIIKFISNGDIDVYSKIALIEGIE